MTLLWKEVLELLQEATEEQLNGSVLALIDSEPWPASLILIAPSNDDLHPNEIYLRFD